MSTTSKEPRPEHWAGVLQPVALKALCIIHVSVGAQPCGEQDRNRSAVRMRKPVSKRKSRDDARGLPAKRIWRQQARYHQERETQKALPLSREGPQFAAVARIDARVRRS